MLRNQSLDQSIREYMQRVDLMCFSSQFYFIVSLTCFGMMTVQIAIEALLRMDNTGGNYNYNCLGDLAFLVVFIITFIICELTLPLFRMLGDIKVRPFTLTGDFVTFWRRCER